MFLRESSRLDIEHLARNTKELLIDERSLKEEFNVVIALESIYARPHFTAMTIQCNSM